METLRKHFVGNDGQGKLSHVHAMSDAEYFTHCMEQRAQPINRLLNTALAKQIDENRQKVMSILKTVIFCGQQNIPLRGHHDDSTSGAINKGNFDALLQFRAEAGDTVLANHFKTASP